MPDFQKLASVVNKILNAKEAIEFHSFIYDLQDRIAKLTEKCSEQEKTVVNLQNQIIERDNWDKEKANYQICQDAWLNTVYRLSNKREIFCAHCFDQKMMPVRINQSSRRGGHNFSCPQCNNEIAFDLGALEK